jgi:hypothetical protein
MKINQVFSNFYTDIEYKQLSEYIDNVVYKSNNYTREDKLGRYYGVIQDNWKTGVSIGGFPQNLLDKTNRFAEDYFGIDKLQVFDIIIIKYCTDFGFVPKLDMHKDGGVLTKYTIDYQHSANIDWPVTVEDQEYQMTDNSVLTFIGTKQMHGRTNRVFSNNEYVQNIFFQFIEKREQ